MDPVQHRLVHDRDRDHRLLLCLPRTGHPPRHLRRFASVRVPGLRRAVSRASLLAEVSPARRPPPVGHYGSRPLQSVLANRSIPGRVRIGRAQIASTVGTDVARGHRAYLCTNLGGTLACPARSRRRSDQSRRAGPDSHGPCPGRSPRPSPPVPPSRPARAPSASSRRRIPDRSRPTAGPTAPPPRRGSPARRPRGRAGGAGPATTAGPTRASAARPSAIQRRRPGTTPASDVSPSRRPPASTEPGTPNRSGGRAVILTGPGANPDRLYIAKLVGGKGVPDPGCLPASVSGAVSRRRDPVAGLPSRRTENRLAHEGQLVERS